MDFSHRSTSLEEPSVTSETDDGAAAGVTGEEPRVSVCLPVRNGVRTMRTALDSALSQDFRDLEVVICDNASDDETPEILREYASRDPRVRYSINFENVGIL